MEGAGASGGAGWGGFWNFAKWMVASPLPEEPLSFTKEILSKGYFQANNNLFLAYVIDPKNPKNGDLLSFHSLAELKAAQEAALEALSMLVQEAPAEVPPVSTPTTGQGAREAEIKIQAGNALMEAINHQINLPPSFLKGIVVEVNGQFFGFNQGVLTEVLGPAPTREHIQLHNGVIDITDAVEPVLRADRATRVLDRTFVALDGTVYGFAENNNQLSLVQEKNDKALAKIQANAWMKGVSDANKPKACISIRGLFYGPLANLEGFWTISDGYHSAEDLKQAQQRALDLMGSINRLIHEQRANRA